MMETKLTNEKSVLAEKPMNLKGKRVLIIVPAYNEQGNIQKTVEEIYSVGIPLAVLVVNDGSKDRTEQEARLTRASVISLPFNLGIGGAVQTGFQYARDKGFDIAVQIDGDTQHDPHFLGALLQPIVNNEAEMAIGSRFLPPFVGYRSSLIRRIGIHFFAHLISFLTDARITDPTSGFRAYNRRMIRLFADYYPQDFPEPEAIVVARRYKAKILEVPVQMRKRAAGSSSIRYLKTFYYMMKVTFAILLDKLKINKELN
jgi:glycosyltransferase involved in cell wall biosynthesis